MYYILINELKLILFIPIQIIIIEYIKTSINTLQ
jgi:hypothetical protein